MRTYTTASVFFSSKTAFLYLSVFFSTVTITKAAGGLSSTSSGTSTPFEYLENDLKACAYQLKSGKEIGEHTTVNICLSLYERFLDHYDRDGNGNGAAGYSHFTKTVHFIHQHNHKYPYASHKLRLNQFADTSKSYLQLDDPSDQPMGSDDGEKYSQWQIDLENFWELHHGEREDDSKSEEEMEKDDSANEGRSRKLRWGEVEVRLLGTSSSIRAENEYKEQPQTQLRQRKQQHQKHDYREEEEEPDSRRSLLEEFIAPSLSSKLQVVADSRHNTKVIMPGDGTNAPPRFSSPQVPNKLMGTAVELHKGRKSDPITGAHLFDDDPPQQHEFSKSLDWSTEHNPDGVPLVHSVFDQGICGSCWAFAATGSVEASAARNFARNHFVKGLIEIDEELEGIRKMKGGGAYDDDFGDDEDDDMGRRGKYHALVEEFTTDSMRVEAEVFEELNLSIQELLDCDVSVDEGCVGGNPLLAFYYIHKHGLVPWAEYPYEGYDRTKAPQRKTSMTTMKLGNNGGTIPTLIEVPQTENGQVGNYPSQQATSNKEHQAQLNNNAYTPSCHKDKVTNPIATVESWGLLHKNHEDLIENALLYVGPVAVGINGADPSFINYGGGIFDSPNCDQAANHALLIVGYDEETITMASGEMKTVRYWIARNSWGEGWGENGFVRVKRGSGGKGIPGVCGIARSPSVALGGIYRRDRTEPLKNRDTYKTTSRYRKDKYVSSYDTTASLDIQNRKNHPDCYSTFAGNIEFVSKGCVKLSIAYERNQTIFLTTISLLVALIAIAPLALSLSRQHRVASGNGSIRLEYCEDEHRSPERLSNRSLSFQSTMSERTHLLTLKDMYAGRRKQEEETSRPRGRSIVITSSTQDPFRLEPSSTIEHSSDDSRSEAGVSDH